MKNGYQIYKQETVSIEARTLLEQAQRRYEFVPNMLAAMVESPESLQAYLNLGQLFQESSFTEEQQHVLALTVSREYSCSYCVASLTAFAQTAGLPADTIKRLREGNSLLDPGLDALRQFAIKMVNTGCQVSKQDIAALFAHSYTHRQILELILLMTHQLIAVFSNRIMGTDLDEVLLPVKWNRVA